MESVHALLMTVGIIALILSWLLLLIYSAREDFAWGLFTLLLPPISYLYGFWHWRRARDPILLAIAGCVLIWIARH
jgi:hypothetical protein